MKVKKDGRQGSEPELSPKYRQNAERSVLDYQRWRDEVKSARFDGLLDVGAIEPVTLLPGVE